MKLTEFTGQVRVEHLDIILCDDLWNEEKGEWYSYTFADALVEHLGKETLLECKYTLHITPDINHSKLVAFLGWTRDKVIFLSEASFDDKLLASLPRNPK